jgi:hypothetical protein
MPQKKQSISRRELLKVMTALGGSVAASSIIPARWVKPALESGVLPAHAQSTLRCLPPYEIVECDLQASAPPNAASVSLVSHAWISPPCPGIELVLQVVIREVVPVKPELPNPEVTFKTDSEGKATANFILNINSTAPEVDFFVHVVWSFFNPSDGSGTCTTEEVHFLIGVPV